MFTKLRAATAVSVAAMGLLLSACGSDNPFDTAADAGQNRSSAKPAVAPELTSALSTTSNDALGEIVVDGDGRTLYRFDQDTTNPPASNCAEACAAKWPPVLAGEQVTVEGIDSNLVGTVDRPDGKQQVTLNGSPLYRFADDKQPGDIKGQGVNGTWFAVTTGGAKAPAQDQKQQDDQQDDSQQGDDTQQDDDSGYGY